MYTANLPAKDLRQTFITLMGIGYAGADFIEAFTRRSTASAAPSPVAAPRAIPFTSVNTIQGAKS